MTLLRAFEEARLALARAGRLPGGQLLALGQEATAVGLTAALAPGDRLFPSRRGLTMRLAFDLTAEAALREAQLRASGPSSPAAHLPVAAGAALAARLEGKSALVLAGFADADALDGLYHETLGLAVRWKAPLLFACVSTGAPPPLSAPKRTEEAAVYAASGLEMPIARVDGQDASAVLEAALALTAAMRENPGPALIECRTYCVAPPVVLPGSPALDERPAPEVDFWRNRDPIRRFRSRLLQQGLAHEASLAVIEAAAREEVAGAARRVFGEAAPGASVALAPLPSPRPGAAP
jgi:TPP-dependent pyruvate/acetoin dehydrogenase alpha subunit